MTYFGIQVEVEGLENFSASAYEDEIVNAMKSMAEETQNFWMTIAGQRLKSSRIKYQKAIKLEGITSNSFTVMLDGGTLTWALEIGTPPYYMNVPKGKAVPMNVDREVIFTSPQVWRSGTGEPWKHPGFPGFNMLDDVIDELVENIAPPYFDEAIKKL